MQYKIVNTFNGWEDDEIYDSEIEAENACDKLVAKFRQDNTANTRCCYAVVDADLIWDWSQAYNRFEWY